MIINGHWYSKLLLISMYKNKVQIISLINIEVFAEILKEK